MRNPGPRPGLTLGTRGSPWRQVTRGGTLLLGQWAKGQSQSHHIFHRVVPFLQSYVPRGIRGNGNLDSSSGCVTCGCPLARVQSFQVPCLLEGGGCDNSAHFIHHRVRQHVGEHFSMLFVPLLLLFQGNRVEAAPTFIAFSKIGKC